MCFNIYTYCYRPRASLLGLLASFSPSLREHGVLHTSRLDMVTVYFSILSTISFWRETPFTAIFFYFLLVSFAIALSIICISYVVIWFRMKLRFARKDRNKRSTEQDRRLAVVLFTVTIVFVFTWMPFQIINSVTFFCEPCRNMPYIVAYFVKFLHYFNSCVNPIIYSFLVPDFRRTVFRIVATLRFR